jgi:hypothetical protein
VSVPAGYTIIDPLIGPIGAGGSESFTVRLDTTSGGVKSGDVVITTNDPDEDPFNFAITGTVVAMTPPRARIAVSLARPAGPIEGAGTTIEFGTRAAGRKGTTRTFRVRNNGDATLNLGNISLPAGFTLTDPLKAALAPGEAESFTIHMETSGNPGARGGVVSIPTNDPDHSPFTFRIAGTIIAVGEAPRPEITVDVVQKRQARGVVDGVSSFAFGAIAPKTKLSRIARTFRVTNDGIATLRLGKVSVPQGFVVLDGLARKIRPGRSDTFVIAPDSGLKRGNKAGQVLFTTNDANETPFNFSVSAFIGVAAPSGPPEISVFTSSGQAIADGSSVPVSFGSVRRAARNPARTFRVRNDGASTLSLGAISAPAGFTIVSGLPGSLAPGAAASFTLGMDTRSTGERGGQVSFSTNDPNENPFNFAVAGAVTAPASAGPAISASLSGGTLLINGTSTIDTIQFSGSSKRLTVVGNGAAVAGSPFNGVSRIVVNGLDGDDRLDASAISIPSNLVGGNGNDTLIGGAANDGLFGGAGRDQLIGGAGVDVFHGEDGDDTLTATDGVADSIVDGGAGNDIIRKDRVDPASGT